MSLPGTLTRRRLPHWFVPHAAHFVTYRLAGTIPVHVFQRLQAEHQARLNQPPPAAMSRAQYRERMHKQLFAKYDHFLNAIELRRIFRCEQGLA
jgi:putative transposase